MMVDREFMEKLAAVCGLPPVKMTREEIIRASDEACETLSEPIPDPAGYAKTLRKHCLLDAGHPGKCEFEALIWDGQIRYSEGFGVCESLGPREMDAVTRRVHKVRKLIGTSAGLKHQRQ
jgi:hypothetical protein